MSNHPAPSVFEAHELPASGTQAQDVVAAWIVVVLLLLGTAVAVTLDHMVTVSVPIKATVVGVDGASVDDGRELHDPDRVYRRP